MGAVSQDRGYQAFRILQFVFVVAPIVAGLDKFFYFLAEWSKYLSPFALQLLGENHRLFMAAVGLVEVIAGIGVFFKPKFFAYLVSIWLLLIIINLVHQGLYLDVALRDLGLMLSAFALGKLAQKYEDYKKL